MTIRVPVAIVGAGIAGLTLALALARRGVECMVLERAAVLAEVGAGLQLSPNASRVLRDLGLGDAIDRAGVRPAALVVRDAAAGGRAIVRLPLGSAIEATYGAPYVVIHRGDLQAALLDAVRSTPGIGLTTGVDVRAIDVTAAAARLTLAGGPVTDVTADVVVGADGVRSFVRRHVFGGGDAAYTGRTAWRATFPAEAEPAGLELATATGLWLGGGAHLVHYPIRAGREINLVAAVDDGWREDGWDVAGNPAVLLEAFAGWPPAVLDLLARPTAWRRWALCGAPDDTPWRRGRAVLIGDAQHAMLPFVAQGGAMAIEDAAVLARHLADPAQPLDDRLARFEAARRDRVRAVVATARRNASVYHLTGLPAAARNAAMRVLGPKGLARQMDWIWGWREG